MLSSEDQGSKRGSELPVYLLCRDSCWEEFLVTTSVSLVYVSQTLEMLLLSVEGGMKVLYAL